MDVFLIADPLAAASCAGHEACSRGEDADPEEADVVIGVHQDNPIEFNAGWYHARSKNANVSALFGDLDRFLAAHPDNFDQQVLNCMLKRAMAKPGHHSHECNRRYELQRDLDPFRDAILGPWTTRPHRVSFCALGGDVLVAHTQPFVLPATAGVHVLTNAPLSDARAKTDVARELGLWPGANGYYAVGGGGSPKYLVYARNLLSTSDEPRYHSMSWLVAALCHLVCLARVTGRVLVLPTIFDFQQFHYAADHVDLRSVEEFLGGERAWRESTFFSNAHLDVAADATTATLAVTLRGRATLAATASDPAPLATAGDAPPPAARAYALQGEGRKKVRDVWAVAAGDPALAAADVLVLDLDDAGNLPLQDCVRDGTWDCGRAVSTGEAPREAALALAALRWCRTKQTDHHLAPNGLRPPPGYGPRKTCAARLADNLVQPARFVDAWSRPLARPIADAKVHARVCSQFLFRQTFNIESNLGMRESRLHAQE